MTRTTRTAVSVGETTLYVAFELGAKSWKLALTTGVGVKPWIRDLAPGDWCGLERLLTESRRRFAVAAGPVVSCYEAGRDGFWIHRALLARGVANRVVDSASIEVNRKARRSKTDRLDAVKLVMMLIRVCAGEPQVWSEVRVPTAAVEAARHVSRERTQLIQDRTRMTNQIRGWLATWGCARPTRRRAEWWTALRDWAGAALPIEIQQRIARAEARLAVLSTQLAAIEDQQAQAVRAAAAPSAATRLVQLKGVATTTASVLLAEGLVWRQFRNRREVGGFVGFAPVPYQSGEAARDVGIDRAGNRRLRAVGLQLAWNWVQWQPTSGLTLWYRRRFAESGRRARLIGIVALARRLLIALWRCATTGEVPAGAILKAA